MAKKKSKRQISIRTITTWTTVASFSFYAIIVGLTGWFVIDTLHSVGQPPADSGDTGAKPLESINVRLMDNLAESIKQKTRAPIDPPSSLVNPFVPRVAAAATPAPSQPDDTTPEESAGESGSDESSATETPADGATAPDAGTESDAAPPSGTPLPADSSN